ncbi:MAG: choice-of-anchor tandem repeat GloVer-containing protein [Candidatus Cybelea sp.]
MGKFARYLLPLVGTGLVILAGCGGSSVPASSFQQTSAARSPSAHKSGYGVVYVFQGGTGGEYPAAALLGAGKKLYGTTSAGGDPSCQSAGCGTVFVAGLNGKYRVLHRFEGTSHDGAFPYAQLTWGLQGDESALYGTTCCGGAASKVGNGTVFVMSPLGKERLIHRFRRSNDGDFSSAKLKEFGGLFYGTTRYGGTAKSCYSGRGCGTVFTIDETGRERVLYSFQGGSGDGATPYAAVTPLRGTLYGTTAYGGSNDQGAIFAITRTGKERVLYSFGGPDGGTPVAGLIVVNGVLYGTTTYGGTGSACGSQGCGTIFSITTAGKEKVLYSFGTASNDGENPAGDLVAVSGKLYGTTDFGGTNGYGTIFSATLSGSESVLHNFTGGTDGAVPDGGLTSVHGTLYGITIFGGGSSCTGSGFGGCGTIFRVTP